MPATLVKKVIKTGKAIKNNLPGQFCESLIIKLNKLSWRAVILILMIIIHYLIKPKAILAFFLNS